MTQAIILRGEQSNTDIANISVLLCTRCMLFEIQKMYLHNCTLHLESVICDPLLSYTKSSFMWLETLSRCWMFTPLFLSVCVLCSCNYLLPLRTNKVHRTCKGLVYGKWLGAQCQQLRCCILGSSNANDIVINSVDSSTSCLLSTQMNCCTSSSGVSWLD